MSTEQDGWPEQDDARTRHLADPGSAKLVRDNIPAIIRASGTEPVITVASPAALPSLLRDKLTEEAAEFAESGEVEELADVLEVVYALAALQGLDAAQLERLRAAKAAERGGFGCRYVWHGNEAAAREPDGDVRPALGEALAAGASFQIADLMPKRLDILITDGGQPGPFGQAFAGTQVTLVRLFEREDGVLDAEFPEPARVTEAARRFLTGMVETARQMGQETIPHMLVAEAFHLRQNGERAPGGSETWRDWERKAERYLRGEIGRRE
jgi:predicted house-cleaning noncanonical NTP pyrophosphatase (MazG superfamily)